MTGNSPKSKDDEAPDGIVSRLTHGRNLEPLLGPWIGCLVAFILVFLFEYELPAFHDFVKIFYFVIAVVFIIATARFFRRRERDRRLHERRMRDRRHEELD
jgi:hypothetical protein